MQADPHFCPIIGVGASAGGLEAVNDMLGAVGEGSELAFVIVQHLDPNHVSTMAELIDRRTALEVRQIEGGESVQPGHAYVIPPGFNLVINDGVLTLESFDEPRGVRRPIDDFFHSLARDQGGNAACVILSGTGSDGAAGLRAIKERGGISAAQAPDTARFDGMPMSAIGTGFVDFILPPEEIGGRLASFFANKEDSERRAGSISDHIDAICDVLRDTVGHDFSGYKQSTLTRRIERRMYVLEISEPADYLARIKADVRECEALLRDVLINVTSFFRDPDTFAKLDEYAISDLVERSGPNRPIRAWVPGCSSGEEAYTIAILFAAALAERELDRRVQIFATDIDQQMLDQARSGQYPLSSLKAIPDHLRERYTFGSDGQFHIESQIRDMVHFSSHSLIKDPPYSKLDLISCRNLLIYFGDDIQKAVIPLFHYALRDGGYLFLGSSESIGGHHALFATVDQKARLYKREPGRGAYPRNFPVSSRLVGDSYRLREERRRDFNRVAEPDAGVSRLLQRYAPAHIILDRHGEILSSAGKLTKYLDFPAGTPTRSLASLARKDFREVVQPMLRRAVETGRRQARSEVPIRSDYGTQDIDLVVDPLPDGTQLIVITEADAFRQEIANDLSDAPEPHDAVFELEEELRVTRLRLRSTVEDLETANEELKSSNEEMMSMNEELQSSNEELSTVNDELKSKADQLSALNLDMRHFLESTELALVGLDLDLNVRTFTDSITPIFPLKPSDRGRSLQDVSPLIYDDKVLDDAREVMEGGRKIQRLVTSNDGTRTYSMQILPYRPAGRGIEGVTLTFSDVTQLESVQTELRNQTEKLRVALSAAGMGVWSFGTKSGATSVDSMVREFFSIPRDKNADFQDFMEAVHPEDRTAMVASLEKAGQTGEQWRNEFRVPKPDGSTLWLAGAGRVLDLDDEDPRMFGVNFDITEAKEALAARDLLLQEMNHRVKNLFTVIISMLNLAAREIPDSREMVARVRSQITAMAGAHNITQRRNFIRSVSLTQLIETVMAPYADAHTVQLKGPDIEVPTAAITPLGLILNEWSTNSLKYGSLSQDNGRLSVQWSLQPAGDGQSELVLEWRESGNDLAPPDDADTSGFGSRLVKLSVQQLRGRMSSHWEKSGVTHSLFMPVQDMDG